MKIGRFCAVAHLALFSLLGGATAQQARLAVDTKQVLSPVSPELYGLMTEEINFSYDGGVYAELVRNRIFENTWSGFNHWLITAHGDSAVKFEEDKTSGPSKALPKSAKLTLTGVGPGSEAGVANEGYWGYAVRPSIKYTGSLYAKSSGPQTAMVRLIADETGAVLAKATVALPGGDWKQYHFDLITGATAAVSKRNHLEILFDHDGTVNLQLVSLFPPTFHDRANGNRPDLMKLMSGLHPHFLRMPGGNYLEGDYIRERFNWKETVGPLVDRPTHRSPWNYTSTDGMGLLEFLEWCEDLKMDPLLAVFAGYALKGEHVVGEDLKPFIADALDEIEYVTGDTNTKWGAVRARDGHPEPFPLHYIEIGNEDWFDKSGSYEERYADFANAIHAKYGDKFKLIASMPIKKTKPDVQDDHYYRNPEEMFSMVHMYDNADRNGPKIFVGEWATRTGSPTPDFGAALGDAAWMTGMERNSDLIIMSAYAPMLTNVNAGGMQWVTDLIGYDALNSYGSPAYWAQSMFTGSLGDHTVKTTGEGLNTRFFWSATVSTAKKVLHLKLVNASDKAQSLSLAVAGANGVAKVQTLHAANPFATNSIDKPHTIEPVRTTAAIREQMSYTVPAYTIQVLEIPIR